MKANKIQVDKNQAEEVKSLILELHEKDEKFKATKTEYEKSKQKLVTRIKNFMFVNGFENGVKFIDKTMSNRKKVVCKKVSPKKIIWDVLKIKRKIDKEISSQFLENKIEIINWDEVVKLLKKYGVNPSEFKKYISVETTVNESKLNQLEELGVIELKDLNGCYEIKELSSYLKISIKEDAEDEGEQSI